MRVLAGAVLMLFASSCAFFRTVKAPVTYEPPDEIKCTTSNTYSTVDFVIAGLVIVGAVGIVASGTSTASSPALPTEQRIGIAGGLTGAAVPFVASGIYGLVQTGKCRANAEKLRAYEYKAFAATKAMTGGKAAREDAPVAEDLVQGKAVLSWVRPKPPAKWALASRFSDGWRDAGGAKITVEQALTSDQVPVPLGPGLIRPPPLDYRGTEGWQALRWGDTEADIRKTFTVTVTSVEGDVKELETTGAAMGVPLNVTLLLFRDRLALVRLRPQQGGFDRWQSSLEAKYGQGQEVESLVREWETQESVVTLSLFELENSILYTSKLWSVFAEPAIERIRRSRAKSDL